MASESMHWYRCLAADFSKNGIGQMGVTRLIEALKHNDSLQTLVLDTNSVGDEGAEALAEYMAGGARPLLHPATMLPSGCPRTPICC